MKACTFKPRLNDTSKAKVKLYEVKPGIRTDRNRLDIEYEKQVSECTFKPVTNKPRKRDATAGQVQSSGTLKFLVRVSETKQVTLVMSAKDPDVRKTVDKFARQYKLSKQQVDKLVAAVEAQV